MTALISLSIIDPYNCPFRPNSMANGYELSFTDSVEVYILFAMPILGNKMLVSSAQCSVKDITPPHSEPIYYQI